MLALDINNAENCKKLSIPMINSFDLKFKCISETKNPFFDLKLRKLFETICYVNL